MASSVNIDNLAGEIVLAVKEYTEDVSKAVEKEVTDTAKVLLKDIKNDSPVATPGDEGNYKNGWTKKKNSKGGQIEYTIYNKNKPSLVHLLEIGHAKVNGGDRVDGIPHVRKNYDKHVPGMEANIKKIIKNGGG